MLSSANAALFTLTIPNIRNDFKVLNFMGSEALSALYSIKVEVVSEYRDFDIEDLLCQPAFLQFGPGDEGIHGRIENVVAGEVGERLTRYHLTLVPALHYLKYSYNQRIFQKLTVPQIITQVLQQHGMQTDVFTFHVRTSEEREYCTQYDESDFEFIRRLCAEDGIAWHHQHACDRHLLVFTDDSVFFPMLGATPYRQDAGMVAEQPVVSRLTLAFSTRTSRVTRRSYDLKRPSRLLENRFTAAFTPELEDYCYPLRMETEEHGRRLARLALERHRVDYQWVEGKSNQPTLRSGHLFDLTEHPRKACNDKWLLVSVKHTGKQPQVLEEAIGHDTQSTDGFSQGYRNEFGAIQADIVYRPPLRPRKKLVSQTARVTGPANEEIHCDEYGRVKVEFHWDRAEPDSEFSSCWLRVASSWAGEGFGAVTIPRVGMEVVVTFLEGDPDQPLITGCVANRVNALAHPLPAHKTRTVLRSQSSPRNGGYSELSIEDRAGQEKIALRAQRDLEQLIFRNSTCLIKGDENHTTEGRRNTVIGGDELTAISGNSRTTADGSLVIQAGQRAHVTASNVVIDAQTSLTLSAGGQHIVINTEGIFSSVPIVEGGGVLPEETQVPAKYDPVDELEEEEEEVEEQGLTLQNGKGIDRTANSRLHRERVPSYSSKGMNSADAHEPGFYVVPQSTTRERLESNLFVLRDPAVMDKFKLLNPLLSDVKAGSMIVLSDPNNHQCTRQEALLMEVAAKTNQIIDTLSPEEADFMVRHRDEIQTFLALGSNAIGVGQSIFNNNLDNVRKTLQDIEALHQLSFQKDGHLRSPNFLAERKRLLGNLNMHLTSLTKKGIGFPDHPNLKRALGLSSQSLVHRWTAAGATGQIPGYATHLEGVAKASKYVKAGGWVGTAVGGGASVLKVREVCSAGSAEECERVKFTESGAFAGGVGGGITAGLMLSQTPIVGTVCIGLGLPTAGLATLACGVVVVGLISYTGSMLGNRYGEKFGEVIFEIEE